MRTIHGRIARIDRMPSSAASNPRYMVHLDNGGAVPTKPDAMVSYGITNSDYRDTKVAITLDKNGHVIGIVDEAGKYPLGQVR